MRALRDCAELGKTAPFAGAIEVRRYHADRLLLLKLCSLPAARARPGEPGTATLLDECGQLVGLGAAGANPAEAWRSLLAALLSAPGEVMRSLERVFEDG